MIEYTLGTELINIRIVGIPWFRQMLPAVKLRARDKGKKRSFVLQVLITYLYNEIA